MKDDVTGGYPAHGNHTSPSRRYSVRCRKSIVAHPLAQHSGQADRQVSAGAVDPSWKAAFNKVKIDSEIDKDRLVELLKVLGHRQVDKDLVRSTADAVTSYNYLDAAQVFEFIRNFQAEVHSILRRDFNEIAEEHNGKLPLHQLEVLVRRRGYAAIPHAIQEVLAEAAAELGESTGKGVSLQVYMRVMHLLEQHEGFCKSDLDILEGAFQRFDEDKNGYIQENELRSLLASLDFFVDSGIVETLLGQQLQASGGLLTFQDFLYISRKRVELEFDLFRSLFQKCDDDRDGLLMPAQVMRLASRLGVSLLPEQLIDLMDECGVEGEAVDFQAVWNMLQVFRAREGFSQSEAADIKKVFTQFDSSGRGELPLRRVLAAITWLGYGRTAGVVGKAYKQVEIASTGSSYMTDAQFLRLARKYREAQLKAIRKVFRLFAADGGAGKLQTLENLQAAVARLNRNFVNDLTDWTKMFRPGARLARKHVSFDFEEFRAIVLSCCERTRQRVHKNAGYPESELMTLRIEFVKCAAEGGGDMEVDGAGLMKLFKVLIPEAQTLSTVHKRLRKVMESEKISKKGVDWHGFLRVIRGYKELTEAYYEKRIQACLDTLDLPESCIDDASDTLRRICHSTKVEVSPEEIQFLAQGLRPHLTVPEAEEVLERMREADANADSELKGLSKLNRIVMTSDLSKKRTRPKVHDVSGSF